MDSLHLSDWRNMHVCLYTSVSEYGRKLCYHTLFLICWPLLGVPIWRNNSWVLTTMPQIVQEESIHRQTTAAISQVSFAAVLWTCHAITNPRRDWRRHSWLVCLGAPTHLHVHHEGTLNSFVFVYGGKFILFRYVQQQIYLLNSSWALVIGFFLPKFVRCSPELYRFRPQSSSPPQVHSHLLPRSPPLLEEQWLR